MPDSVFHQRRATRDDRWRRSGIRGSDVLLFPLLVGYQRVGAQQAIHSWPWQRRSNNNTMLLAIHDKSAHRAPGTGKPAGRPCAVKLGAYGVFWACVGANTADKAFLCSGEAPWLYTSARDLRYIEVVEAATTTRTLKRGVVTPICKPCPVSL